MTRFTDEATGRLAKLSLEEMQPSQENLATEPEGIDQITSAFINYAYSL
jgi:hypothetical protein